jgi:hypothetical protein
MQLSVKKPGNRSPPQSQFKPSAATEKRIQRKESKKDFGMPTSQSNKMSTSKNDI